MSDHPDFALSTCLGRHDTEATDEHGNDDQEHNAPRNQPSLTNYHSDLFLYQVQPLLGDLADASASFNFWAQSSQHTSTVLPPILTLMEFSSSWQSHAAHVFAAIAFSSNTRSPDEMSRPYPQGGLLSESLAIYWRLDLATKRQLPEPGRRRTVDLTPLREMALTREARIKGVDLYCAEINGTPCGLQK